MSPSESIHIAANVRHLLLLVWVHGFKGNQSTFADFPADVGEAAQARFTEYDVTSIIYPKYRTVGEIDLATHAFVGWLFDFVVTLEAEKGDGGGVHTTVILFGHSMGGMLVADAAKEVCDARKAHPEKQLADVRGVIDTPFIGIHPSLVLYGVEQMNAYIDKTLLDTAAFFDNSPKFLMKGLKKMGISKDNLKPSRKLAPRSPGRLEKGFTNVLAVPGTVSSSEWDWTSAARGGGLKGLKRAWSGVTGKSEVDEADGHGSGKAEVKALKESDEDPGETVSVAGSDQSVPPPLPLRRTATQPNMSPDGSPNGIAAVQMCRNGDAEGAVAPENREMSDSSRVKSRDEADGDLRRGSVSPTGSNRSIPPPLPPRRSMSHPSESITGGTTASTSSPTPTAPESIAGPDNPSLDRSTTTPSLASVPDIVVTPSVTHIPQINPHAAQLSSDDPIGSSEEARDTPSSTRHSSLSSLSGNPSDLSLQRTSSSTSSLGHTPMIDPNTISSNPVAKKQQQKKNWRWLKAHTEFMSSCWSVAEISGRMKCIDTMQSEGMYFSNIYTIVKGDSSHSKDRTFVSLPTIHHPTKDSWKPFIHDSAADQVEAHMALFNKEKHKGYGRLIGVIGDEIEEVLKRAKG